MDDTKARATILLAVAQTKSGDVDSASETIYDVCLGGQPLPGEVLARMGTLVIHGADLCGVALRERLGDSDPHSCPSGGYYALELVNKVDGERLSFDDVTDDPCISAALRCISGALNHDLELLIAVMRAHIDSHGPVALLGVIAELINYVVAFGE